MAPSAGMCSCSHAKPGSLGRADNRHRAEHDHRSHIRARGERPPAPISPNSASAVTTSPGKFASALSLKRWLHAS